MALTLTPFDQS